MAAQLYTNRLPLEAEPYHRRAEHLRLDPWSLGPVNDVLFKLAKPAVHHKSLDVAAAALTVLLRLTYLEPARCLSLVADNFDAALAATESTHQLEQAITFLAGAALLVSSC